MKLITTTKNEFLQEKEIAESKLNNEENLIIENERYQVWKGFGGCFNELGWKALSYLTQEKREEILKDLFEKDYEFQFNYCRLPIGANDYSESWYSLNECENDFEMKNFSIERDKKYLIPYINSAKKYNENIYLFASPWSPPSWMKFPKAHNFGTIVFEKKYLDAYALYFSKFVEEYKKENININMVYVQNEPLVDQKFPSCIWKGEEMVDFIRDYMGPTFESRRTKADIGFGTLNGPPGANRYWQPAYNEYCGKLFRDKEALKYVKAIGYQWDGKEVIQRTHQANPEITLVQTENECGDGNNTWEYAHYIFDLLYHYLSNNISAYTYWNMVLEPTGLSTWGWHQNSLITVSSDGKIIKNPEYYVLKHFSKYIRPGYQRVKLSGIWSDNAIAFEGDNKLIIIVQNPFDNEEAINLKLKAKEYSFKLKNKSFNTIILNIN